MKAYWQRYREQSRQHRHLSFVRFCDLYQLYIVLLPWPLEPVEAGAVGFKYNTREIFLAQEHFVKISLCDKALYRLFYQARRCWHIKHTTFTAAKLENSVV